MSDKLKVKWKVVAPLAIGVILSIYLVVSIIVSIFSGVGKKDSGQIYTLCGFNKKQTLAAIAAEDKEHPVGISDYNFYGESLNLFFDDYTIGTNSSIGGKNVVFVDMCSSNKIEFNEVSTGLDSMIKLNELKPGYYAVYLNDQQTLQRVFMYGKINERNTFTTIVRNGKAMKVELVADKAMFNAENAEEDYLDKNYLYVNVTEVEASTLSEYEFDIALVTAPALTTTKVSLVGEEANGTSEAKELWDVAEQIKSQLTNEGYRVTILKEAFNEDVQYYGTDGVLARAYDSNAKYMIYLDMSISDSLTGVIYSSYTDNQLASSIFEKLFNNTSLYKNETKLTKGKTEISKYVQDSILYDSNYEIREAGGKILGTGVFSTNAEKNSFASEYIYGINTIKVVPCNIKNAETFKYFIDNKTLIANAIADGIISYLK